ncbi:MAG: riboflavin synthase [Desulfobacterales bacterium]|nr:riboflavin synthase [Desulfobacterales bacterium]
MVLKVEPRGQGKRLTIELPAELTDVQVSDSINVNGACLTVVEKRGHMIGVDLSSETLQKTTFADVRGGERVNLERALKLSGRLGGHIVTGHSDGVGIIVDRREDRDFLHLKIRIPKDVSKYTVQKGSIAVDGISLTVNECTNEEVGMTLIPYTLNKTTLIGKKVGERVNVEVDILAKYVEKLLGRSAPGQLDLSFLKEHGFLKEE